MAGLVALIASLPTSAAAAPPPPTVQITSPTAASTVKGTVAVTAEAAAGTGDTLSSLAFYDGVTSVGGASCNGQTTCTATVQWKATGLTGDHTLTARVSAGSGQQTTSAGVTVTVVTPPAAIAITSPAAGGTVKGTVEVDAEASSDPALEDYPTSIAIYDGVDYVGSFSCQAQKTCAGSVKWKATGKTGAHALTARATTARGTSVTSAPVTVAVVTPPPTVRITAPRSAATLKGTMTVAATAATDPALADYPTSISFFDGTNQIGGVSCQAQQTCSGSVRWATKGLRGQHRLTAVVHTTTGATATSAAVAVGRRARTRAKAACRLAAQRTKVGKRVNGSCTALGVPRDTAVTIKARTAGSSYATVVRTTMRAHGLADFFLRGRKRGVYHLVVVISANRRYLRTVVPLGTLRIA